MLPTLQYMLSWRRDRLSDGRKSKVNHHAMVEIANIAQPKMKIIARGLAIALFS